MHSNRIACLRQNARSIHYWYLLWARIFSTPYWAWWSYCYKTQESQGWVQTFLITGCKSQTHTRAAASPFGRKVLTCCPVLSLCAWMLQRDSSVSVSQTYCLRVFAQKNKQTTKKKQAHYMTTYCPGLTLSLTLFAHSGFAKKLPSSKQPCSKNTSGLHQRYACLWRQLGCTEMYAAPRWEQRSLFLGSMVCPRSWA